MTQQLPPGPLIVGFDGTELDAATAARLQHPAVGGVILFSRNFADPEQLKALCAALRALRDPKLLITVDQEGGRVQRFRHGFTLLPALAVLGRWYRSHPDRACDLAYRHGRIMAAEVLGHGLDLSWAPVLDLDRGSVVIGDRAMAESPEAVADLAGYYIAGMRDAGMAACAKHFPGHGTVAADSHHEVVTDPREWESLVEDMTPFARLADQYRAVMMAHVCYPARDERPAGFSSRWIKDTLRRQLGFSGLVVSDDLDMAGAATAGGLDQRLAQAFEAGCDLALVCQPDSAAALLERDLDWPMPDPSAVAGLYGQPMATIEEQTQVPEFRAWRESLQSIAERNHD
ncbi:MAG: beta-N-acetylhexosaminidase [Wenzhouxiangella sp.]|nr:MAG: beta-N-acetylhexosaminidase [Wenzhouxiangella sp.]